MLVEFGYGDMVFLCCMVEVFDLIEDEEVFEYYQVDYCCVFFNGWVFLVYFVWWCLL